MPVFLLYRELPHVQPLTRASLALLATFPDFSLLTAAPAPRYRSCKILSENKQPYRLSPMLLTFYQFLFFPVYRDVLLGFPKNIKSAKRFPYCVSAGFHLGADEGNRTPVASLGSWSSAIEPHPHVRVPLLSAGLYYYIRFQQGSQQDSAKSASSNLASTDHTALHPLPPLP